jgi:FkbM family methyltransferase
MLIDIKNLHFLKSVNGIIHIGAHDCEERSIYLSNFGKLTDNDIVWIDALKSKVNSIKAENPTIRIFNECISNNDNESVIFNITNNYQSSSFLNLKEHLIEHPDIYNIKQIEMKTKTLKTFYNENNFSYDKFNFMILDIQGAELLALKGAEEILNFVDFIYLEVNTKELYENGALLDDVEKYLSKYNFQKQTILMTEHGWGDAFYVKNTFNILNNYKIEYGIDNTKIDITDIVLKNKKNNNFFHIPKGDEERASLFGDHVFEKVKNIYISDENNSFVIKSNDYVNFNTNNNTLYINTEKNIKKLCFMAIFKNETMNLRMWLEHYLWQGVEHFYLIDNGSTDNPFDILQEYIDKGIVSYYYRAEKYQQVQHYRYVFDTENLKEKTELLCICDLDEFFFGTEQKLVDAICEFDEYNVIYTNSFFYGSDNLIDHPKDIRTAILHREEDIENGTKYIFKPSAINDSSEIWIHWLVNSGTIQKKHMNEITQNNKIRLNHYRIQSFEYFKNVKMTRGDVSVQTNESIRDLTYFENYTKIATIKDDILKQIVENGYNNLNKQPNTAVIVEPRFLKHLPFVINDFYKKLGQGWKVVFYCGEGLKNIWLDLINNEDIEIRELKNNCYKYNEYCDFIKSKELWENLYGDYVLVFTANSTIINKPPYTIDYYMSLNKSYIGGNQCYLWNEMKRENIYPQSCNFQGGLSLRKRLDMIKIIDTFGSQKTLENCGESKSLLTDAEDVYFAIGCYKLGLPVGDDVISSHFSVHNYLKDGFFGANCLEPGYYLNLIQKYDNICDNIYLFKDISYIDSEILSLHPSTGFFSNCTVKLFDIILYFNAVKKLPIFVDSSKQLDLYKFGTNMNDITHQYFSNNLDYEINYEYPIDFREQYQYSNYENLNFKDLTHFVKKYFTPSEDIKNDINYIENKYNINNYHDICVLFYRGNDKATEIKLPSYESIVEKARTLYNENNNIKFLVQSDEIEFIERMIQEFPNNSFYFKDEIRTIKKTNQLSVDKVNKESNFVYSQYYLAITIIMSKCKYIVCNTGNCSLWIALFRGNTDNLYQIV